LSTIPASRWVQVLPSVLSAGGNALILNGIMLTHNYRVPIGQVLSFPNTSTSVSAFFGANTVEATNAEVYFAGYTGCTQLPESLYFARYPSVAVPAWLLGGNITTLTIPQLQALTGSLDVVIDGYAYAASSLSMSSATSYTAAAALIAAGLNNTLPTAATVTGSIAPATSSFTGSIAGNVLYVTSVASGTVVPGTTISGTGVTSGTLIQSQLTGTTGGIGTYAVSASQIVNSTTISGTYGTLTVTNVASGTISIGQTLSGAGVTSGTQVWAYGTGQGLDGTYFVSPTQTEGTSETITATGSAITVTFDSVSGGFLIESGSLGTPSTIAYATGTIAAGLLLTQSTGATLSQGSYAQTPSAFMNSLTQLTTNWASFMTLFDPDGSTSTVYGGNTQKLLFSAWVNTTNDRYVYVCWDSDITPTESVPASTSMGYALQQNNSSGSCPIYDPLNANLISAFICGAIASVDFGITNGRITFDFRSQTGLTATVSNPTIAANLSGNPQVAGSYGNGYNYYGAGATAAQSFIFFDRGTVSGPFLWLDSYVNQIWMNAQFQLALMELLTTVNSIPYNQAGYSLIEASVMDVINQALNFGAIRAGVPLSALQAQDVNLESGLNIAGIIQQQGWYIQIQPATPQVRQGRASPPFLFWYTDGESVQALTLSSIDIQ
jgi:hypothetical protein